MWLELLLMVEKNQKIQTMPKNENKRFLIISIFLIIAIGIVWLIKSGIIFPKKIECETLTPLALQKFESLSGVRPIFGQNCKISSQVFLAKILYDSENNAQKAKTGILAGTTGKKQQIENYDWVVLGNDSSVFIQNEKILGIVALLDIKEQSKVKTEIERIEKNDYLKIDPQLESELLKETEQESEQEISFSGQEKTKDFQNIDLSKDITLYEYTKQDHECADYKGDLTSLQFQVKCEKAWGMWRGHWVKEINISSEAQKLQIKADLALIDHSHLFTECSGEGVKYDNYVILIAESKDPRPQLNQECNKISSEQDWAKCAVRETESSVLGYCGVEKCTTSKECDFEINVQEKDKIYLVFRISDAWDYADVQGILSNVQISGLE